MFSQALGQNTDPWRVIEQSDAPTPEAIDRAAEVLNDAMQVATQTAVPVKKPSEKARPWWSRELTRLRQRLVQQRMEAAEYLR